MIPSVSPSVSVTETSLQMEKNSRKNGGKMGSIRTGHRPPHPYATQSTDRLPAQGDPRTKENPSLPCQRDYALAVGGALPKAGSLAPLPLTRTAHNTK